jgi:hypothetical protein
MVVAIASQKIQPPLENPGLVWDVGGRIIWSILD